MKPSKANYYTARAAPTALNYTYRKSYRMPAYQRLDLGATLEGKKTARFESSWTFSIYNAYGHANPYTIAFQQDPKNPTQTQALQTALFKMVDRKSVV